MFLPDSNGFAPNINIQVQQYDDSLKSYLELSIIEFKQMKLKVIQNKLINNNMLEYSAEMKGRNLHWYAMEYLFRNIKPLLKH